MSSVALAISTQTLAQTATESCVITPITLTKYSKEDVQNLKHMLIVAAKSLPTPIGGGENGHIFLFESLARYTTRTGSGFTKATSPGAMKFTGTSNGALSQEKLDHAIAEETYHVQEGAKTGIRKTIVASAPHEAIAELEDPKTRFNKVDPRKLLVLIETNADMATVLNTRQLKYIRDVPLEFEGDKNLATQFTVLKNHRGPQPRPWHRNQRNRDDNRVAPAD